MTAETRLSKKTYFEELAPDTGVHPVQVLGTMLLEEHIKEDGDASEIRFAQGEVYFHNKDYEAAIFKWEHISNGLDQWARKNMADAYMELGMDASALDLYKSIETESLVLKVEVALQLFSLYLQQEKQDAAVYSIKKAVALDPDYQNISLIARAFFEEHEDWENAVELASNETIRTQSLDWAEVLKSYIDRGLTERFEPSYFNDALVSLHQVSPGHFEELVLSLWNSYTGQPAYLPWLNNFNNVFQTLQGEQTHSWRKLSKRHEETYLHLISGRYTTKELSSVLPGFLVNWLTMSDSTHAILSSAAVLAWNDLFPDSIPGNQVYQAENLVSWKTNSISGLEETVELFDAVKKWSLENEVEIGQQANWMVEELLDLNTRQLLVAGSASSGKSSFINSVLDEPVLGEESSTVVIVRDHHETEIREVASARGADSTQGSERFIEYSLPSAFLRKHGLAMIDSPGFNSRMGGRNEVHQYINLADSLLFILSANAPFTPQEAEFLLRIRDLAPDMPIHFILNKMDTIYGEEEARRVLEDTEERIAAVFPDSKVFAYSSHYKSSQQLARFNEFFNVNFEQARMENRVAKLLYIIRTTITDLFDKRLDHERALEKSIAWNEDMVSKLNGAIHQLEDLEKEKSAEIRRYFHTVKSEIRQDMTVKIPEMIRACSKLVREDSDFGKIHLQLNEEMNQRIQLYMEDTVLPMYRDSLYEWIASSHEELMHSQAFLDEMSSGFNKLFETDRMELACDFKIAEDWRRDVQRMTSGVQLEKVNILLRHTPSQFLLKSAGKLINAIAQNKTVMINRYTQYIENEDYTELTESIITKFLLPFDVFENGIDRDLSLFFQNPDDVLKQTVIETQAEIAAKQSKLLDMKNNQGTFKESLTLFELRLRQYEWMLLGSR
ncbi:dynamin family protein [Metabacillus sp. KIGAM252]|uniref:Dynamin family protein n=1 Tax=Metabacillus flavus TaxID=2823519 RepID=A0ABS5LAC3_9BACI|nr:dynamin family protein [Metabacillus flavus]MBS2967675.1 dynamin family protein [Metabacillus flavus]